MSHARIRRATASRIALASQGFGLAPPTKVTMRQFQSLIDRLALLQIDSVNVLARAQLMPMFSRFGSYPVELLGRAAEQTPRRLYEAWAHVASLIDVNLVPALSSRRKRKTGIWGGLRDWAVKNPQLLDEVSQEVARRGPLTAREFGGTKSTENWGWNWTEAKHALEWLFQIGELGVAGRTASFERRYAIPSQLLPAGLENIELAPSEADDELVSRSAKALGIGSLNCLADYFRLPKSSVLQSVSRLEKAGKLTPIQVTDWDVPVWRWHEAKAPRSIEGAALVSPFDSLIFYRPRALALFGLDYRIEIYVPAAKRKYGYYVYPLLWGEQFVARFDLAAARRERRLLVKASWLELESQLDALATAKIALVELRKLASWLGLQEIEVAANGTLSSQLRRIA